MANYMHAAGRKLRASVMVKLIVTATLAVILLIPAEMIRSLIDERAETGREAREEISSKWGRAQTVGAPVLTIPYRVWSVDSVGRKQSYSTPTASFFPGDLNITGDIEPEIRYRGIFEVVAYTTKLHITGTFKPEFARWDVAAEDVLWNQASVSIGIPDIRGLVNAVTLNWDHKPLTMGAGVQETDLYGSGLSVKLDTVRSDGATSFALDLKLNGSGELNFLPLGDQTTVTLRSSWPSPSFDGAYLPSERTVSDSGFSATWSVLGLKRNYPQQWVGSAPNVDSSAFGVGLIVPVDHYQQSMRSAKYAGLFIGLTFLTFFLIEILNRLRLHPIQYLLVGFALVLFYLLLVSLSEHIGFGWSYLAASAGIVGLITAYAASVFRRISITAITFFVVATLYGYLYVLLQLEDFALLLGSVGLFVILAAVMYVTRRMDWYEIGRPDEESDADDEAPSLESAE